MDVKEFSFSFTFQGKKYTASGSVFRPAKETLYRVSIPWEKSDKAFVFTKAGTAFRYYKHNIAVADGLQAAIAKKLKALKL